MTDLNKALNDIKQHTKADGPQFWALQRSPLRRIHSGPSAGRYIGLDAWAAKT